MNVKHRRNVNQAMLDSCDLMLEALDRGSCKLILEATAEFKSGVAELQKSIKSLKGFLTKANKTKMDVAIKYMEKFEKALNDIEQKDLPDKYSFKDHEAMLSNTDGDEGTSSALGNLGKVPAEVSKFVNGFKDGIIEIAKWLETEKELFSVGKNGIIIYPDFLAKKSETAEVTLSLFSNPSGEELLSEFSGLNEEEEMMNHFKDLMGENISPEDLQDKWKELITRFSNLGAGAQAAYDKAISAIAESEPAPEVQEEVPKKSILASLFGTASKPEYKLDRKVAEGILGANAKEPGRGLFSLTFEELQIVIAGLLEQSGVTDEKAKAAVRAVQKQTKASMTPDKKQEKVAKQVKEIVKDKDKSIEVTADLEKAGMKDNDASTVNPEKLKQELEDTIDKEEQVDHLLAELEIESTEEHSLINDIEDKERLAKNLESLKFPDVKGSIDQYQKLIKYAIETKDPDPAAIAILKLLQNADKEEWDQLNKAKEDDKLKNLFKQFFEENKEGLQEAKLVYRWSVLAGIIRD